MLEMKKSILSNELETLAANTNFEITRTDNEKKSDDFIINDNKIQTISSEYYLQNGSLFKVISGKNSNKSTTIEVCSDFYPIGYGACDDDENYGFIIQYKSKNNLTKEAYIFARDLFSTSGNALQPLINGGLKIRGNSAKSILDAMREYSSEEYYKFVVRNGWSQRLDFYSHWGKVYSLNQNEKYYSASSIAKELQVYSIKDWNQSIVPYLENNPLLIFSIGVALAAPLLKILNAENILCQFTSNTTRGKTKTIKFASTIMASDANSAKSSKNGLEALALANSDSFISLDELAEHDGNLAKDIYNLLNGSSASRMGGADTNFKHINLGNWRLTALGTGEDTVKEKLLKDGKIQDYRQGLEVRAINLDIRNTIFKGMISSTINGLDYGEHLSQLLELGKKYEGVLGRAFLKALFEKGSENGFSMIKTRFNDYKESFKSLCEDDVEKRVAEKFAAIATALWFAVETNVLERELIECENSTINIFKDIWQFNYKNGNKPDEEILKIISGDIVSKLKKEEFVETDDKFQNLIIQNNNNTSFYGFVETVNDEDCYFISMDYEKALISNLMKTYSWISQTAFRNLLKNSGYLQPGDKNGNKGFKNTKTHKGKDYLVIKASIENILM